jgi:hypothetical protein
MRGDASDWHRAERLGGRNEDKMIGLADDLLFIGSYRLPVFVVRPSAESEG